VLPNPLAATPRRAAPSPTPPRSPLPTRPPTLRDSRRELILNALETVGWVVGGSEGAAARLGLNRTTLINMMKRLGIERPVRRPICDDVGLPEPRYAG
jgi:transcriptional regulator with GAF, ATPase, and Fis domain